MNTIVSMDNVHISQNIKLSLYGKNILRKLNEVVPGFDIWKQIRAELVTLALYHLLNYQNDIPIYIEVDHTKSILHKIQRD